MPFYDFRCEACGEIFTIRATFKEKKSGLCPECPKCHAARVRQLIGTGLMILRRQDGTPMSRSGCCGSGGEGACGT